MTEEKKVCTCCQVEKPADTDHFYSHPGTKDGLQSVCIPCNKQASIKSKSKRKRYYSKTYLI